METRGTCEAHNKAGCICLLKNNKRNTEKGWHKLLRRYCLKGHELTPDNVIFVGKTKQRRCKFCNTQKNYDWHKNNPEKIEKVNIASRMKRRYRLTQVEYDLILEKQNGLCGICNQLPTENGRFAIDHNHVTNEIRGLVHRVCNTGIGNLKDSSELCRAAANYLDNPPARGLLNRDVS